MKYLLLTALFLIGCGGSSTKQAPPVINKDTYKPVDLGELLIRDTSINGGITERSGDNWYFESHTNLNCIGVLKGSCRKADVVAQEGLTVAGRVIKYSFIFNIVEYPLIDSPDFVIVFQDWVRIKSGLSNHPITTLKLKNDSGFELCSYNNSWQFDWAGDDWSHVSDGSIHDHPSEELNGCHKIDVGVDYNIELFIDDDGRVELVIDDAIVFNKAYQTKSPDKEHIFSWGLYWSKGYNLEFDPTKRVIVTIERFSKSILVN